MAWGAVRKLRRVVDNVRRILAVEWVAAARGIELRAPLEAAPATRAAIVSLRAHVAGPGPDRLLSDELRAAEDLLSPGRVDELVTAVEAAAGRLA